MAVPTTLSSRYLQQRHLPRSSWKSSPPSRPERLARDRSSLELALVLVPSPPRCDHWRAHRQGPLQSSAAQLPLAAAPPRAAAPPIPLAFPVVLLARPN